MNILLGAIAALIGIGGGWWVNGLRWEAKYVTLEKQQAAAVTQGISDALKTTVTLQRRADEAARAAQDRNRALSASADAARSESERLRLQLEEASTNIPRATHDSLSKYASTLGTVFADCSAQYQTMGGNAQGHASDVTTLMDAWPKKAD